MTKPLLLAALFFVSIIVQVGSVNSFTTPLALIPLHFLLGVLVLHRSGPEWGAAWFLSSAFIPPIFGFDPYPWFGYLLVALLGAFLTTRLFTNRSVYALEGLAVVLYLLLVATRMFDPSSALSLKEIGISLCLVILTTYVGFLFARFVEKAAARTFYVKHSHETS